MPDWNALLFGAPAAAGAGAPEASPDGERVPPAFRARVDQVAQRLRMDPQHLLAVMRFETGGTFSPSIRNQAGSGATGLIQFMPQTAAALGTTTDALARMTPEAQLAYVERYLQPYTGRLRSLDDTYMAVLYPAAIGTPPHTVLFRAGTRAYAQNRGLDAAGKGSVTVGDAVAAVRRHAAARGPAAPAGPTDWGAELFGPPRPAGPQAAARAPTDWGQVLFGTP